MKVNPQVLKGKGDLVRLNEQGLSWTDNFGKDETFVITEVAIDQDDMNSCVKENGFKEAEKCSCYLRYTVKNGVREIDNLVFDEFDIVDLKENRFLD